MGNDYFIGYAEGNIVSILILLIILSNDWLHNTKQEKQIWFYRTISHIFCILLRTFSGLPYLEDRFRRSAF